MHSCQRFRACSLEGQRLAIRLLQSGCFFTLFTIASAVHATDPVETFRPWSAFGQLDLAKLARGRIETECNASMKFPRGISTQAVFVVAAPVETVVHTLLTSDPLRRPDSDVYQHRYFHNETDANFAHLRLDPKIAAVQRVLGALRKGHELQLSREERDRLPRDGSHEKAREFCAELLRERWLAAHRSELGVAGPYDLRAEIGSLLKAEPRIAQHFATLLAPFTHPGSLGAPAVEYWDISNVNHTAALELGAIYQRTAEGCEQLLDVNYYASSGYLVSVTLYELVPIKLEGQSRTLAWQAVLVSAEALEGGFGLKRQIAARLMIGDVEESVRTLRQEAAAEGH
jgi:hypothetical protein